MGLVSGITKKRGAATKKDIAKLNKQILKDIQSLKVKGTSQSEVHDTGAKKLTRSLAMLNGSSVSIGFPGGKDYVSPDGTTVMDVARLAIIHELGSRSVSGKGPAIPSRPANRLTYSNNLQDIKTQSADLYNHVLKGLPVRTALARLGVWYEAKLKVGYRNGPFKPLSAATLAARRRRNRPSTVPLIDTRTLVNSISSKVNIRYARGLT
jgi:hypothetical protein